jgi:hypothetical protein
MKGSMVGVPIHSADKPLSGEMKVAQFLQAHPPELFLPCFQDCKGGLLSSCTPVNLQGPKPTEQSKSLIARLFSRKKRALVVSKNSVIETGKDIISRSHDNGQAALMATRLQGTLQIKTPGSESTGCINQAYRGQLKVKAEINPVGLLTVSLIQAIDLLSEAGKPCDTFVEVAMLSTDGGKVRTFTTETVSHNPDPVFNEDFKYQLKKRDIQEKRIVFTVGQYDPHTNTNIFVGCFSFGLYRMFHSKMVIDDWFYLLDQGFGKHKHLKVTDNIGEEQQIMSRTQSIGSSCFLVQYQSILTL